MYNNSNGSSVSCFLISLYIYYAMSSRISSTNHKLIFKHYIILFLSVKNFIELRKKYVAFDQIDLFENLKKNKTTNDAIATDWRMKFFSNFEFFFLQFFPKFCRRECGGGGKRPPTGGPCNPPIRRSTTKYWKNLNFYCYQLVWLIWSSNWLRMIMILWFERTTCFFC
jgi:hypothetical protein